MTDRYHPAMAIQSIQTRTGTVYVCTECSDHWFREYDDKNAIVACTVSKDQNGKMTSRLVTAEERQKTSFEMFIDELPTNTFADCTYCCGTGEVSARAKCYACELRATTHCYCGGKWGTDGAHSNEFCKRCYRSRPPYSV